MTIREILHALGSIAPPHYALDFDHIGLQIGDLTTEVRRAAVSLDRSQAAAAFAAENRCQLLLSHHPLIWDPLSSITEATQVGKTVSLLIRSQIAFIAAHTNWDCAVGGINDTLAKILGLQEVGACGSAASVQNLKMAVFVPEEHAAAVIDSASAAGAGVIGLYRRCAFLQPGVGTFIGGEGSNPSIGRAGNEEKVEEVRVEMVVPADRRSAVENAAKAAHPYETPAIDFYLLEKEAAMPICRLGSLDNAVTLSEFVKLVDSKLNTRCWAWGQPSRKIGKVAVCGGAADDEWANMMREGADLLLTGEVRQHIALEASEAGFAIVAAGHYATEHPGCVELARVLGVKHPEVEWLVYEPQPGQAGRPL